MPMQLGALKKTLALLPQDVEVMFGFTCAHSYRGYYDQVAFEPATSITVAHMAAEVERALTEPFEGYKGGTFTYNNFTPCWLSEWGHASEVGVEAVLGLIVTDALQRG